MRDSEVVTFAFERGDSIPTPLGVVFGSEFASDRRRGEVMTESGSQGAAEGMPCYYGGSMRCAIAQRMRREAPKDHNGHERCEESEGDEAAPFLFFFLE